MGEVHLEISRKKYRLLCVSFHCLNRDTMSGFRSLLTHQDIPTTWQPPASGLLLLSWSQTDWWYSLNCLKCHFHSSFWSFCLSYVVLPVTEIYDFTAASVILSLLCWLSTIPLLRPSSLVFHQVCSSVHFSPFSFFFFHSHRCHCCSMALRGDSERNCNTPHSLKPPHKILLVPLMKSGRRERWAAEL